MPNNSTLVMIVSDRWNLARLLVERTENSTAIDSVSIFKIFVIYFAIYSLLTLILNGERACLRVNRLYVETLSFDRILYSSNDVSHVTFRYNREGGAR